jgi:Tfp pilus assembly protein PilO
MITDENLEILGITGTDDELAQQGNTISNDPKPVAIPFQVNVKGSLPQIQSFITKLEHSIRPFQVQKLEFAAGGNSNELTVNITAQTYYQPGKTLSITKATVK